MTTKRRSDELIKDAGISFVYELDAFGRTAQTYSCPGCSSKIKRTPSWKETTVLCNSCLRFYEMRSRLYSGEMSCSEDKEHRTIEHEHQGL